MEEELEASENPPIEDMIQNRVLSVDMANSMKSFQQKDEFIHIENFFSEKEVNEIFVPIAEQNKKFIHRNYIPFHKKGGSISSFTISQKATLFWNLYESRNLLKFLSELTGRNLYLCTKDDPHSVALYYYTEAGDHIGYHYDSSFYNGTRFTVLIGIKDNSSCRLNCELFRGKKDKEVEKLSIRVAPGAMVVFNGDKVWHCVTPLAEKEERIILSLEFVTDPSMGRINRVLSNVKDAVTYFGVGSFFGKYEGYQELRDESFDAPETILAFVNKNSGGRRGAEILPELRNLLGNDKVFDLNAMGGPREGLERFKNEKNLKIMAIGGDGTVRWVIEELLKVGMEKIPPIGVIPLGTGNDLSRMLGWGGGYAGENPRQWLESAAKAEFRNMDLWTLKTDDGRQEKVLFNYLNVGYDPAVALKFHSLRSSYPSFFFSRIANQMWYTAFGVGEFLVGSHDLSSSCKLWIDDEEILIPKGTRTLVFLNFRAYQAGVDLWGDEIALDDGIIEVAGIGGIVHEVLLRLNASNGTRLGKGSRIRLQMSKKMPMGVDGEPFECEPCTIELSREVQTPVLINPHPFL